MRLQQEFPTGEIEFAAFLHGSNSKPCMSLMGQKWTRHVHPMSALPPKADIGRRGWDVRFAPTADSCSAAKCIYSITSSAAARSVGEKVRPSALAVFALITSSNLVDCCTGKSAGFAPLRMRPV